MTRIETVVLDMAGTTVVDDGIVLDAFARAWDELAPGGVEREDAIAHVIATMGQSKIEVFRVLVDEDAAQQLNEHFERALADVVREDRVTAIPGAADAIRRLQADGRDVVLTTGFSRATADAIVAELGWQHLPAAVLTPADAGRGRPAPDLNLLAALRTQVSAVAAVAVVGDTESDARSGVRAGAGLVVGVRTGGVADDALRAAGAMEVIDAVTELPGLLQRLGR
ncbi:HAD family hydrolase [Microbacterium sp.]|uniref:HAD family hydrolase n=1 Tax=Microbacterium sp. TaxID=51671 RepID=UPI003C731EF5